jgi:hypothetical protein
MPTICAPIQSRLGDIREVDRLGAVGAEILDLVAGFAQYLDQRALEREPGVITANC